MNPIHAIDAICLEFDPDIHSKTSKEKVLMRGQCHKWIKSIQVTFNSTAIYAMWNEADDYYRMQNDICKEVK